MKALLPKRGYIRPSRFCYRQRLPPFPPVAEPLGGGGKQEAHQSESKAEGPGTPPSA